MGCSCEHGCCHGEHDASEHCHCHSHGDQRFERLCLLIGAVFFCLGFLPKPVGTVLSLLSYVIAGLPVFRQAISALREREGLDENVLMAAASLGAVCIGEFREAAAVMVLSGVGERLSEAAAARARRSVQSLTQLRPERVTALCNGQWQQVSPEALTVGMQIRVRAGERIAADCVVREGTSALDTAPLTGEALPRPVQEGDEVPGGCVNLQGVLVLEVLRPYADSAAARILRLTEEAQARKAKTERFMTRFAKVYTPVVLAAAVLIAVVPVLLGGALRTWLYRALTILTVSCPCALLISVPLAYFVGMGAAAKQGILIKGGVTVDALAEADSVAFDKTGTLTTGQLEVRKLLPQGISEEELLRLCAVAEQESNHPLAQCIRAAAKPFGDLPKAEEIQELAGKGVSCTVGGRTLLCGTARFLQESGISVPESKEYSGTAVHLAAGNRWLGVILCGDQLRSEVPEVLASLRNQGFSALGMLTGDTASAGESAARSLSLDFCHAELLPEQKTQQLKTLQKRHKLLYVGDGINDAPTLAAADAGIAMGGIGSDAAVEAADVVLLREDLGLLPQAVASARSTRSAVKRCIFLSLGMKLIILILAVLGVAGLWTAVLADVGAAIAAVLSALPAGKISKA